MRYVSARRREKTDAIANRWNARHIRTILASNLNSPQRIDLTPFDYRTNFFFLYFFRQGDITMKRLTTSLIACIAFCASGFAVAQEEQPVSEHLKPYGPMLGTWVHEGPLMEDLEGHCQKGHTI